MKNVFYLGTLCAALMLSSCIKIPDQSDTLSLRAIDHFDQTPIVGYDFQFYHRDAPIDSTGRPEVEFVLTTDSEGRIKLDTSYRDYMAKAPETWGYPYLARAMSQIFETEVLFELHPRAWLSISIEDLHDLDEKYYQIDLMRTRPTGATWNTSTPVHTFNLSDPEVWTEEACPGGNTLTFNCYSADRSLEVKTIDLNVPKLDTTYFSLKF